MSVHGSDIHTTRLILRAATCEHLQCELDSPHRLGDLLGAQVPASWPPGVYDRDAMEFFLAKSLQGGAGVSGWYGWYAIRRDAESGSALLVASAGYFGPPSGDGTVEIGYSVVPEERGKGIATEMVDALTVRALESPGVKRIVAEVHQTNLPSMRVLERCDFVRMGRGREEDHWRYQFRGVRSGRGLVPR